MTMLLKKLDFGIQLLLIFSAIFTYIFGLGWQTVYFTLGGWQIFSLLVHHFIAALFRTSSRRRAYAWSAVAALAIAIIGLNTSFLFMSLVILLVGTPVLALWYLSISYLEIRALNLRELVHTKR